MRHIRHNTNLQKRNARRRVPDIIRNRMAGIDPWIRFQLKPVNQKADIIQRCSPFLRKWLQTGDIEQKILLPEHHAHWHPARLKAGFIRILEDRHCIVEAAIARPGDRRRKQIRGCHCAAQGHIPARRLPADVNSARVNIPARTYILHHFPDKMQAVNALPVKASVPQAHIFKSAIPHLVKISSGKYRCEAPLCGLYTHICNIEKRLPIPAPPAQEEAPQPDPTGETQHQRLLRQLREAGAALSDPALQDKAARLEAVSARIFALAEADPGKEDQLRKFTSYYLPTALKLLHTYAQLDGQGVDGENITKTKQSIERSLDLLVTAFENQLDKLFQSDALDVSADIAALEGMLNLDGLSGANDFTPQ